MEKSRRLFVGLILIAGLLAGCATGSPGIKGYMGAAPEDYGLSSRELSRISQNFQTDVKANVVPGAVALIARKGKIIYFENFGMQVKEKGISMSRDSIFRIYSMTKPVTSVAALILYDQGKLDIDDSVSKYLPEFRNMKVGIEEGGEVKYTEPVKRDITVKDLMMHTSGLSYGVFISSPIRKMYLKAGINSWDQPLSEMTKKLGKIPLLFQPGTQWEYSRSTDVLGRVVEVASGMRLDRFMETYIFQPLGMKDTGFSLKQNNRGRLAEAVGIDLLDVRRQPVKLSGGGGLVSTAEDYYRFAQMLLNGGEFGGKRILKEETVTLMTQDHLGELSEKGGAWYLPGKGYGFGLGVAVRKERNADIQGTIGGYWWEGIAGTGFWVDPEKQLVAIIMIQNPMQRLHYRKAYRDWVYKALQD